MITLEQARDALKRAMEARGRDFVYRINAGSCLYEPAHTAQEGDPRAITGCIVGEALKLLGEVRHFGYSGDVRSLSAHFPDMLGSAAVSYLQTAQLYQDRVGATWGGAYDAAEAFAVRWEKQ